MTDDVRSMSAVVVSEYDPAWPERYAHALAELDAVIAPHTAALFEHIGSTAVVGLCAKPVIDILVGVNDLASIEPAKAGLAALGYRYRPEYESQIPGRRYFTRPPGTSLAVHLHVVALGGDLWCRHLAFRDALRNDAALAASYASLKRDLAVRHAGNKAAYTEAKAPFIVSVLRGAVDDQGSRGAATEELRMANDESYPDGLIGRVCRIPQRFRQHGNVSIADLLRESGYLQSPDSVTFEKLERCFRANPVLIDAWVLQSDEQRSLPAWFLSQPSAAGGKWLVGYVTSRGQRMHESLHDEAPKACAKFVVHWLDSVSDVADDV